MRTTSASTLRAASMSSRVTSVVAGVSTVMLPMVARRGL
jgi:hypothetical protein